MTTQTEAIAMLRNALQELKTIIFTLNKEGNLGSKLNIRSTWTLMEINKVLAATDNIQADHIGDADQKRAIDYLCKKHDIDLDSIGDTSQPTAQGDELPELPTMALTIADEPGCGHYYTADQMHEYARAAIDASNLPQTADAPILSDALSTILWLEYCLTKGCYENVPHVRLTIESLKAAIAANRACVQTDLPKVAVAGEIIYVSRYEYDRLKSIESAANRAGSGVKTMAIGFVDHGGKVYWHNSENSHPSDNTLLYAHPIAAPVSWEALTDEKIVSIWNDLPGIKIHKEAEESGRKTSELLRIAFARAIFAAAEKEKK
jgi:hypothetical protein